MPVAVVDRIRRAGGLKPDMPGCDFCGADLPQQWTRFECAPFDRTAVHPTARRPGIRLEMRGGWAACRRCEPHVAARAWRPLLDRYIRVGACRRGYRDPADIEAMDRAETASLWLTFERHATGERVTVTRREWEIHR